MKGYCIKDKSGELRIYYSGQVKSNVIDRFIRNNYFLRWKEAYRKGYRCVKINIKEVSTKGEK